VSTVRWNPKGMRRSYRAVINGGHPRMNRSAEGGQGRARTMGRRRSHFTHRTKVYADGTVRKNKA